MRKSMNFSRNNGRLRPWTHVAAAVSLIGSIAAIGALPACSNALKVSTAAGPTSVLPASGVGEIAFKELSLGSVSLEADVVAVGYTSRNKGLVFLSNKSSIALDLEQESGAPALLTPTLETADNEAKIYPFGRDEYWALTASKAAHVFTKDDGGEVVTRAEIQFGGEPQVLAANRTAVLVRVGQLYKLLRVVGKFEFVYDGPLDFRGRTAPLSKIVGAGIVGDSGFWVSDGERVVSMIFRSPGKDPEIIAQKFKVSGLGNATSMALLVAEKDGKLHLQGSALAVRGSERVVLRSGNLDAIVGASDVVSDPVVADLIKNNCIGCHGDTASNNFKGALKVSAWKASADKIKFYLEGNSMPPGGTALETRQKLGQFLKSVSGVEVNIAVATATPTSTATPDPAKINEFNNTYRALIRASCVNGCHDHLFDEANDVTFDAVKRNAVGMKRRLDNRTMPNMPVTITDNNRTLLSNWLGTLNP
jgi:hypothetical protein